MSSSPEAASSPASTSEIDYEALAKAAYVGFFGSDDDWGEEPAKHLWEREVRAVVAAYEQQLRDRGFVVLGKEDADRTLGWYSIVQWSRVAKEDTPAEALDAATAKRIRAALVAAPESRE